MAKVDIIASFEPKVLRANSRNEAFLILTFNNNHSATYWCECDINVKPPLSLAHDTELNTGRTKVGILKPNGTINKKIRIFTRPGNFPDEYPLSITAYIYDEDGAISERLEKMETVLCKE